MNIFNDLNAESLFFRAAPTTAQFYDLQQYKEISIKKISASEPVFEKIGNFGGGYIFKIIISSYDFFSSHNAKMIPLLYDFIIKKDGKKIRIGDGTGFILSNIAPPGFHGNTFVFTFTTAKPQNLYEISD